MIFKNPFHDEFGSWALGYIPYGGADFGEVEAIAAAVGDGDDSAYYDAWIRAADRLNDEAETALASGHRTSARELFLKTSCFYACSYHPIYGEPVDPRLTAAFRKQTIALNQAFALDEPAIKPVNIPFEDTPLPAYFIPAAGQGSQVRPLIIFTNGYDGTITDMYFASAVAASRRGYHCLLFDGPGQGAMLVEHGVRMRPDWETVVKSVVDYALTIPVVDPARIAISGWSLGGYLATRAASGEHRLAACIADPGQLGLPWAFQQFAIKLGASLESAKHLGELDQDLLDRMWQIALSDRKMRWAIVQRNFWVHGVNNLRDYFREADRFTMEGREASIRCPTLFTHAEDDSLAGSASQFFDKLKCPKTLIKFTRAEGAGDHCEMSNRSALDRRVLDWLDRIFSG